MLCTVLQNPELDFISITSEVIDPANINDLGTSSDSPHTTYCVHQENHPISSALISFLIPHKPLYLKNNPHHPLPLSASQQDLLHRIEPEQQGQRVSLYRSLTVRPTLKSDRKSGQVTETTEA